MQLTGGETVKEFASLNSAVAFAQSLTPVLLPEQEVLNKTVNTETEKLQKKILLLKEELAAAEDAEQQRIIADTLMANLYRIAKGSSECMLENIYDGTPLAIKLAPDLTANENAQKYYKRYNKLKRAQAEIKEQLKLTEEAVEYLGSIDIALKLVQTRAEVAEIKAELAAAGFITIKIPKIKCRRQNQHQQLLNFRKIQLYISAKTTNKTITLLFQSAAAMIYGSIPKTFPVRTLF